MLSKRLSSYATTGIDGFARSHSSAVYPLLPLPSSSPPLSSPPLLSHPLPSGLVSTVCSKLNGRALAITSNNGSFLLFVATIDQIFKLTTTSKRGRGRGSGRGGRRTGKEIREERGGTKQKLINQSANPEKVAIAGQYTVLPQCVDGPALDCRFGDIHGLAIDEESKVCFIADHYHAKIRKLTFA